MADHRIEIDAVKQPAQLLGIERYDRHLATGPAEPIFRQSFQYQHKTGALEEQQLHSGASTIAKDEDSTLERAETHRLLDQDRQAVDTRTEVDRISVKIDAEIVSQPEHSNVQELRSSQTANAHPHLQAQAVHHWEGTPSDACPSMMAEP